jgi:DMSO/TMAO reductase YedYZ molybdopterin-dependent catalytic subunit
MKKIFFVVTVLMAVAMIAGCAPQEESQETIVEDVQEQVDSVSEATLSRYAEREIRQYKGMKLDPAVGPRDNSISGTQYVDIDDYELKITGIVDEQKTLTYDDVLAYDAYERLTTLYCVEGWEVTILWKGVKITDLLKDAGADRNAKMLIFKAVDGYTTGIPIEEVMERNMILAYMSNGINLPPQMGYPFIVVAEDKLGYKWARWVNEIEVSSDADYKGYWESRGYSNEAEVPENRYE